MIGAFVEAPLPGAPHLFRCDFAGLLPIPLSLLAYRAVKKLTFYASGQSETHGFALVVLCCVAALPFMGTRYADVLRLLRANPHGIGVIVLVQVLFNACGPVPPAIVPRGVV